MFNKLNKLNRVLDSTVDFVLICTAYACRLTPRVPSCWSLISTSNNTNGVDNVVIILLLHCRYTNVRGRPLEYCKCFVRKRRLILLTLNTFLIIWENPCTEYYETVRRLSEEICRTPVARRPPMRKTDAEGHGSQWASRMLCFVPQLLKNLRRPQPLWNRCFIITTGSKLVPIFTPLCPTYPSRHHSVRTPKH